METIDRMRWQRGSYPLSMRRPGSKSHMALVYVSRYAKVTGHVLIARESTEHGKLWHCSVSFATDGFTRESTDYERLMVRQQLAELGLQCLVSAVEEQFTADGVVEYHLWEQPAKQTGSTTKVVNVKA